MKELQKNEQPYYTYFGELSVKFLQKHLLVLELNGDETPFGAAHGTQRKINVHINLMTGQIYQLKDLFKLLIEPLIGAIAAGNCAVLKPSELVPNVSTVVTEMISGRQDTVGNFLGRGLHQ